VWPQSKFSEERELVTDVLLYIYVLVVLNNGQTWPKILKMSFLNRFYRDKKTITNSFLEIIVRYMLENSLKSSKKKMWL